VNFQPPLAATHVFLETIHYFVILLCSGRFSRRSRETDEIPLSQTEMVLPKLFAAALVVSPLLVAGFGSGLDQLHDHSRDVYHFACKAHVLAEFPFLIKML
jgi:hypothetical protein